MTKSKADKKTAIEIANASVEANDAAAAKYLLEHGKDEAGRKVVAHDELVFWRAVKTLARATDALIVENDIAASPIRLQRSRALTIIGKFEGTIPVNSWERASHFAGKVEDARKAVAEADIALAPFIAEDKRLDAIYREHFWSRFFLVTNLGGHVHSSMRCGTCYSTTRFAWLPNLSAATEAEAIEEEGASMCTTCFPSAPLHPRFSEPSRRDQRTAAEKDAAKQVKLDAKAAKRAAKVERDAKMAASDLLVDLASCEQFGLNGRNESLPQECRERLVRCFATLMEINGTTFADELEQANKRAKSKWSRDGYAKDQFTWDHANDCQKRLEGKPFVAAKLSAFDCI